MRAQCSVKVKCNIVMGNLLLSFPFEIFLNGHFLGWLGNGYHNKIFCNVTLIVALGVGQWLEFAIARANKPCLKNPLHLLEIPSILTTATYQLLAGDRPKQT